MENSSGFFIAQNTAGVLNARREVQTSVIRYKFNETQRVTEEYVKQTQQV